MRVGPETVKKGGNTLAKASVEISPVRLSMPMYDRINSFFLSVTFVWSILLKVTKLATTCTMEPNKNKMPPKVMAAFAEKGNTAPTTKKFAARINIPLLIRRTVSES